MYSVPLVVHSSRIGRSIIVAIVGRPAVAMPCYWRAHSHRRHPTDSPNPARPNFGCYCSLTGLVGAADAADDATIVQLLIDCAATVAGIVTMIRQLAFPRNTPIHCLRNANPIWGCVCARYVCVCARMCVCVWSWWWIWWSVNEKKE